MPNISGMILARTISIQMDWALGPLKLRDTITGSQLKNKTFFEAPFMSHIVSRTLSAFVLFAVFALPVSFLAQTQQQTQAPAAKKPTHSRKSTSEKVLTANGGAAQRAKTNGRRDRKTSSASQAGADDSDQPARPLTFRATDHPREDRLVRGHSFHGDVRTLPQIPPARSERAAPL